MATSTNTSLEAKDSKFLLDGKEILILSGAVHYFRIVPEYWEDRLLRLKACGLNTVETYVPWNLHEETRGEFNFEGMLDVRRFIQLAKKLDLHVLFRPGPYICSEWDFGGLPSWLLHDPEMKVRSAYKPYLDAVDKYFARLLPEVADLQYSNGGPIIAVQIENEYGSYGDDLEYKNYLKECMTRHGVTELYFTSDNGAGIQHGQVPGVLMTANFQEQEHGYLIYEYFKNLKQPGMPLMVMEFWSGWFDHWGEKHHIWPLKEMEKVLNWILDQKSSLNLYMFHGGTNFGFMNGANEGLGATNEKNVEPYAADVTSYDYDSPVAENGDLTDKWYAIKETLQKKVPQYVPDNLPEIPQPIPSKAYGTVNVEKYLPLEELLKHVPTVELEKPAPMEALFINNGGGQGYGFILYRKKVSPGNKLTLMGKIKDRAIVYMDHTENCVIDWNQMNYETALNTVNGGVVDILVENMGRVNYADFQSPVLNDQRKGLRDDVLLDGKTLTDWTVYPLEFKKDFMNSLSSKEGWVGAPAPGTPNVAKLTLKVQGQPRDTYVDMQNWTKGLVFVNGFNLGRYWEKGPQKTLYLPGPLLNEGDNEILVVELHKTQGSVGFVEKPDLGEVVIHTPIQG